MNANDAFVKSSESADAWSMLGEEAADGMMSESLSGISYMMDDDHDEVEVGHSEALGGHKST
jgi:hypothetical protein